MSLENSVAIDGPAGAGKSTIARLLASKIGYRYVSTGDLYRGLALAVLREGADWNDEAQVVGIAAAACIKIEPSECGGQRTFLDGEDVTDIVHTAEVNAVVSPVSVYPEVRRIMVEAQRAIAREVDVVMDGRDIGTVVLAESRHKFYLAASVEERARRRWADYAAQGAPRELADVVLEIEERDRIDSSRRVAPLRPADDAQVIDCTSMRPMEVVNEMLCSLGRSGACSMGS